MIEGKELHNDLLTLEKFAKQVHMYTPDRLRSVLKITIDMAKKAVEESTKYEALMVGLDREECLVIFPQDSGLKVVPGDDVEMAVPAGDAGVTLYRAKVDRVQGSRGEICRLKDLYPVQQAERREAFRFPVRIAAEYCYVKDDRRRGEAIASGQLLNISRTGLFMASDVPLRVGKVMAILFEVDWDGVLNMPMGVVGTIVREEKQPLMMDPMDHRYLYGVKFKPPRMAV